MEFNSANSCMQELKEVCEKTLGFWTLFSNRNQSNERNPALNILKVQIKGVFNSIKNLKNFKKGQMVLKFPRKVSRKSRNCSIFKKGTTVFNQIFHTQEILGEKLNGRNYLKFRLNRLNGPFLDQGSSVGHGYLVFLFETFNYYNLCCSLPFKSIKM